MLRFYTDLLVVGLQAITAGYFYHTARLGRSGQYRTVKHQQVGGLNSIHHIQSLFYSLDILHKLIGGGRGGGVGDVYRIKILMTSVHKRVFVACLFRSRFVR